MAQTYTLEEAAQRLGISPDEMKRRLKEDWKSIRSFRDGNTLRFRAQEIDELSRTLGLGSDAEVSARPSAGEDAPLAMADGGSTETMFQLPDPADAPPGPPTPKPGGSSGDYFRLAEEGAAATPRSPKPPRPGSDSDVRLEGSPATPKPGSKPRAKAPAGEVNLDAEKGSDDDILSIAPDPESPRKSGSSARMRGPIPKTPSPKSPPPKTPAPRTPKPTEGSSSDFELKLEDSSDEFELSLDSDSSSDEEVELGAAPSGKRAGDSGINLQSPSDSGVSLEKASDSEIDFELSLDPVGSSASSHKMSPPKSGPIKPDSDSEFELTLDSEGELAPVDEQTGEQKDIFETDFEIPALDEESASEAVALEEGDTDLESSDFDLAEAEEPSDEESPVTVETALPAVPKGRRRKKHGEDEDEQWAGLEDEEEEGVAAPAVAAAPAQWGVLPALVMIPCVIVLFLTGVMGYELLRGMWGYQQPGAASGPVVRTLAPLFGDAGKEAAKQ